MVFSKTGDAPIVAVKCACGGNINLATKKCEACGKDHTSLSDDRRVRDRAVSMGVVVPVDGSKNRN